MQKKQEKNGRKIVIINQYGITPELPGATKHYDMAKHFANQGNSEVEFWMCGYNHHTGKNHRSLKGVRIYRKSTEKNLKLVRIKSTPYRKSSLLRQLNHTIFDLITALKILFSRNIDLIILSIPPISFFNVWAIKTRRIKLVTDVEDLWPLFLTDMGLKNKFAITYMDKFSRYTYNSSDAIAPVSSGMIKYIKKIMKKPTQMWLAPLGVNLEQYNKVEKDDNLVTDKVWKDDYKIMYIGAHGKANNIYPVLDTIKKINNKYKFVKKKKISFVFIGDGDDKKNIISYSQKLGLQNVYFEDAIPGNLVANYLKHADICLTNLKKIESFKLVRPNKLFQYMALGKPIISGIWGESADIVVNEARSGIYVDFDDNKTAANKIIDMLENPEKLSEYNYNGISYIRKYGDRNKIYNDYYERIINIIK